MLPTLKVNAALARTVRTYAVATDSLSTATIAEYIRWAATHYAVNSNTYPESASYDAALCVAACIKDLEAK